MDSSVVIDKDGDICIALRAPLPSKPIVPRHLAPPPTSNDDDKSDKFRTIQVIVSSQMISRHSPVFERMLTGPFREATDFAKSKAASQQYTISLPEDDPAAMILLLRFFHADMAGISEKAPNPELLEKVAFLCDKYDCKQILRFSGSVWLAEWIRAWTAAEASGHKWDMENSCRALVFAYVADLPREFMAISMGIVLNQVGTIGKEGCETGMLVNHPLMWEGVADLLDEKRMLICQIFHNKVTMPLTWEWKSLGCGCFRAAKTVGQYLEWLRQFNLPSRDLQYNSYSLNTLFNLLREAPRPAISTVNQTCNSHNCPCRDDVKSPWDQDLGQLLIEACQTLQPERNFLLCLDCIKTNGESKRLCKCRIAHVAAGLPTMKEGYDRNWTPLYLLASHLI